MKLEAFSEEEIDLRLYWAVISRKKWNIIFLAVLCSVLATLYVFSLTPIYRSTATLLLEKEAANIVSIEEIYGLDSRNKEYLQTQVEILESQRIAKRVIDGLGLAGNRDFLPEKKSDFLGLNSLISEVADFFSELLSPVEKERKDGNAGGAGAKRKLVYGKGYTARDKALKGLAGRLSSKLRVSLVKKTQMVKVSYESRSPELAANIANAVAQAYIDDYLESRIEMTRDASVSLSERLVELKKNLDASEKALQDFLDREKLVDVRGFATLVEKELKEVSSKVIANRLKLSELSKRYGPKHPVIIAAKSELESAEADLAASKVKIRDISRKEVKIRELKREIEGNRELYNTFLSRVKETTQTAELASANARIVDAAVPSSSPSKPKKGLIVSLVFFASLMFGVLLAFLQEALDKTFKSASDVEAKLGQPMLGMLPLLKAKKKEKGEMSLAMIEAGNAGFAEAIRTIRTGVMLSSLDNPHKVLLITSSVPGEGKSTVATNLAAAMAQMEKVILIDADMRRPSIAKSFGLPPNSPGLSNLAAGSAKFRDCIHRSQGDFDVLAAGQIPPNPLELLSSDRFEMILQALEKHYDRIIVDSAPVQAVSDSLVISKLAKAVIYVVKADSTAEHTVKTGIKRLLEHEAPLIGVVINQVDMEKAEKYGYEYGGYYDQYSYHSSSA